MTESLLDRVRGVSKRFRLRLDTPMTGFPGARPSVIPGPGMSFAGFRDYQHGDDFRLIDWNVFARYGRPSIKVFQRDRASQFLFVVDASGSMQAPDGRKWMTAVEAVSVVAMLAAANGDRVGCLVVTDRLELTLPLGLGERHARGVSESLVNLQPSSVGTDMTLALTRAASMLQRNSALVVASDCLDPHRPVPGWIGRLAALRRHRVTLLAISSPLETTLPDVGVVPFSDAETRERRWIDTHAPRVRQAFARNAARRRRLLLHQIGRAGATALEVRCDHAVLPQLGPIVQRQGGGWG